MTGVLWAELDTTGRTMAGGPANDELLGHHGSDRLSGAGGDDILWGDSDIAGNTVHQHDVLRGGAGNDWLYPSHGSNTVSGGPGNDHVWAFYGHGRIDCGPGHDVARVRLNGAFTLRNCEVVEHFCAYGSDGHGGCLKPGGKAATKATAAQRVTTAATQAPAEHTDQADVPGDPLDITAAAFGQQPGGRRMTLRLATTGAWDPSLLASHGHRGPGTLCVGLFFGSLPNPRARVCVVVLKGAPAVRYTRLDPDGNPFRDGRMTAVVDRPDEHSIDATFSVGETGLALGRYSWQAQSTWSDAGACQAGCVDRAPDNGNVIAQIKAPPHGCFGAAARDPDRKCDDPRLRLQVRPSPSEAQIQPSAPCAPIQQIDGLLTPCTFGDRTAQSKQTFALLGDSHAGHWRAALAGLAAAKGWHGVSMTRASCPFSTARPAEPKLLRDHCETWKDDVAGWLDNHPEVSPVFISEHSNERVLLPAGQDQFAAQVKGYIAAWRALPASVKRIVVIRDTPRNRVDSIDCVRHAISKRESAGLECAVPRAHALEPDPAVAAARRIRSRRVDVIDLTHYLCGPALCYPVIGGALVHKDIDHLTETFSQTMAPYLLRAVNVLLRTDDDASARGPRATAARACPPPRYPGVGYFTSLDVSGATCTLGRKLVLAYYRCRIRSGPAGRCAPGVLGFRCSEQRNTIPTQINARVTCRRRGARITHTYQQDT